MRRTAAVVAAALVVVVAVGAVLLKRGRASTPATVPAAAPRATLDPGILPRPGVHLYAQAGWEQAKAGPLTIRRTLPPRAVLVIGGRGDVVQEEWRFSKQHLEATRRRVGPEGRYSVWQRTRLSIVITQDQAHDARPVTLSRPAHMRVGERWVQDYTVGGVRSVSRNRVAGTCGPRCFVVVADSRVHGAHPGTDRTVTWESEATRLVSYERIDRKIGGRFPYELHVTLRLLE